MCVYHPMIAPDYLKNKKQKLNGFWGKVAWLMPPTRSSEVNKKERKGGDNRSDSY